MIIIIIIIIIILLLTNITEKIQNTNKIPKIIHQIWLGPKTPPLKYMNQWKNDYTKMYPDFKYMFWGDEDIKKLSWPTKLKHMYDKETTYYGKSDIVRLVILNQYGGIYIDSDSVWVNNRNLNDLIEIAYKENTNIFAGKEPTKEYVANGVIGTTKNNKSLLFVIKELEKIYPNYEEARKKKEPWQLTGPLLLNKAVEKNLPFTVLSEVYFYPFYWHNLTSEKVKELLKTIPNESYMYQLGYSTNNNTSLFSPL
jgi:mannosyltransferase OCH1-like enzyme